MRIAQLLMLTILLAVILPFAFGGPIHDAARAGDVATLKQLLAAGANIEDISDPISNKSTPLILAARYDEHGDTVELLLKKGASTEVRDAFNQTPLVTAVQGGRVKNIRLLLDHGAKINDRPDGTSSAVNAAIHRETTEILSFLLSRRAEIQKSDISMAAYLGRTDIIRLLLEKKVSINDNLGNETTLLMHACLGGHTETVRFLLDQGADISLKASNGSDLLAFCKEESVRCMIEEEKQKQEAAGIVYWLSRTNYDSPALTEALITAETTQLPDWLASATVQQKVALLTDVKKQLARASVRIDELNAEASAAIAGKQDPVPFRKRAGQVKAYISVLAEIKAILEQS